MPCLDDGDGTASVMAFHLVTQILETANAVVNTAKETGQPWRCLMTSSDISEPTDMPHVDIHDVTLTNDNSGHVTSVITSTPEKINMDKGTVDIVKNEDFGQGDGVLDLNMNQCSELESTSTYINNLFDMSEVERVIICDDIDFNLKSISEPDELLAEAMCKIMESYVSAAFDIAMGNEPQKSDAAGLDPSRIVDCYSFLTDAFIEGTKLIEDPEIDGGYCIEETANKDEDQYQDDETEEVLNITLKEEITIEELQEGKKGDNTDIFEKELRQENASYEKTYLTLNRDDDQCSEDEGDNILEDPRGMALQEVELMTANTSVEILTPHADEAKEEDKKELTAISAVSASSRKSKSSLVSRCRSHGARLLSCLRGWWRRKTPGKHKESRTTGSIRGICPLSPDGRRRALSLLDQRHLYSPSSSHHKVGWKFNTVNEAVVNSRWKEYTFESSPDDCGEC